MSKPFVAALTGSIGMGKSETAKMFARLGIPVHDADAAVHELYGRGGGAVAKIDAAFPGAVVEGSVDRARLAERVARDENAFRRLEAIVHPLVLKERDAFSRTLEPKAQELVVLDIPASVRNGPRQIRRRNCRRFSTG